MKRQSCAALFDPDGYRLTPHGLGILVVTHTDEDGLTQLSFGGPLVELHLDNDTRAGPVRLLVRARLLDEGTGLALERTKPAVHVRERCAREAATGVPGIDQLSLIIIVAEQNRAEVLP